MVIRNKVSAFLHPLTVIDSVAATLNRKTGKDDQLGLAKWRS
ncbi:MULTISPECIES: hypothetical protein [Sulfolobaceae]|nr:MULTISPECIES: hypothetical protein [unclassified Sulfolobus]